MPRNATALCPGAAGGDGMPVVFSHPLDESTLQKEDFVVTTKSGARNTPFCVTLAPAVGAGELRTVLLIGEFGGGTDPPVTVRIVGDIMSDGKTGGTMNFQGAEVTVVPLESGPTLVWAEDVPKADWSSRGRGLNAGTICPHHASHPSHLVRRNLPAIVYLLLCFCALAVPLPRFSSSQLWRLSPFRHSKPSSPTGRIR